MTDLNMYDVLGTEAVMIERVHWHRQTLSSIMLIFLLALAAGVHGIPSQSYFQSSSTGESFQP